VDVAFGSGLDEIANSVLYLPFGQMLALGRSLAKGLNPDRPENLDVVVVLA
jgi:glucosamine 6-phosphate synthetase-like amidotransferase/phosphosugar isomerase protein